MKLTAIGEIKTLKVGDTKIDIQLTIVDHGERSSFAKKVKIQTDTTSPPYFAPERYRRQVKRMGEHLKGAKAKDYTDSSDILYRDFHIAELEKCVSQCSSRQRLSIVKAGEGVLYVAVSLRGRNFSSRMNASEKSERDLFEKNAHLISEHYLSIHSMGTPNYPVQYGHVLYQRDLTYYLQIGCWPLFWYPIKASVLRKLYLQEVIVFTLLNPTFIIEALKTYDIVCRKSTHVNKLVFSKELQKRGTIEMQDIGYYFNLAKGYLHTEKGLAETINEIMTSSSKIPTMNVQKWVEIKLQHFFNAYNLD